MSISPSGRIAHVWLDDENSASLDVFLITAVELNTRNGKPKRPPRKRRS